MPFEQFEEEGKSYLKAVQDGVTAGLMMYSRKGKDVIVIEHTEVDPAFSGQGIGKQMVLEFAEFARKEGLKVIPVCSFARSVFNKVENIRDVLL